MKNLYYNTVLDGSVTLFVLYRNHLLVVQFHSQAHIRNPHGMGQFFKTIWGASIFFLSAPKAAEAAAPSGAPMSTQILLRRLPKGCAEGAAPPEFEGNPAEGGSFAKINI